MTVMGIRTKFKTGDSAFIVGTAFVVNNLQVYRIPLGTEVKVRTISVINSVGHSEVRYGVNFNKGSMICWLDERQLGRRILDVVAA